MGYGHPSHDHGKPYNSKKWIDDDPRGRNSFASSFCWLILNYTPENPCMVINIELAAQKSLTIDKHRCIGHHWTW